MENKKDVTSDLSSERAKALKALRIASEAASDAAIKAREKFPDDDLTKMMEDRDNVKGLYLDSLEKSIQETGACFETMVKDLETEASAVRAKAAAIRQVSETINMLADLLRLAADLAKVFV